MKYTRENTLPTVAIPKGSFWKRLLAFVGPGLMIAVGYMDPGNWATDIEAGAKYAYLLLSVIFISNLFAMVLQYLSLKLGIVTGRDLAQMCRETFHPTVNFILWILCETAIAACDLAEVIGSAIALNLLFHIPLSIGTLITGADVFLVMLLQKRGARLIEIIVAVLIFTIFACFAYEIFLSKPDFSAVAKGLIPQPEILKNPRILYLAAGILGATVMPHNLYLHSNLVQSRDFERTPAGKKEAIKFATIDSTGSLLLAFFINAAILVTAAATFHFSGNREVADINTAYEMLTPILGSSLAGIVFAVALLASGQNATLTGTIAGQIVLDGFLNISLSPWLRRLITRLIAIIPAFFAALYFGEAGISKLLVFSQVVLSLQLGFAVVPLIIFTGNKKNMQQFANSLTLKITAWSIAAVIISLNIFLVYQIVFK